MNSAHPPSVLKRFLRLAAYLMLGLVALAAIAAALLGYFLYVPAPESAQLTGTLSKGAIQSGALTRRFLTYIPRTLTPGAPLLVVMHGSGETGEQIRVGTGHGFERLADRLGFAIVYPNSYTFDWNDCSTVGDYRVNGAEVDDLGFLAELTDKLIDNYRLDRTRVFATGVSAGGSMSMRLALEAPSRYRAVAAVAANVPQPGNFKCKPAGQAASILIMNGTEDPLVPFEGGEVNLMGMFYKAGYVRSTRASGQYFAELNGLAAAPNVTKNPVGSGVSVERIYWSATGKPEVELLAIHGGGHSLPQPYARRPRLLGPSPMAPHGPELIWAFFARQP